MEPCKHTRTTTIDERPFTGPVTSGKWAEENFGNPMAHGNVTYTVRCDECDMTRRENRNGRHVETGAWGMSEARKEMLHEYHRANAQAAGRARILRAAGIRRVEASRDGETITVISDEGRKSITHQTVQRAAAQADIGDGLPQVYRAILAEAGA